MLAKRKAKLIAEIMNNPIELTDAKLASILEKHSHTVFGKDNHFATAHLRDKQMPLIVEGHVASARSLSKNLDTQIIRVV